jgi:hypothetical protein
MPTLPFVGLRRTWIGLNGVSSGAGVMSGGTYMVVDGKNDEQARPFGSYTKFDVRPQI